MKTRRYILALTLLAGCSAPADPADPTPDAGNGDTGANMSNIAASVVPSSGVYSGASIEAGLALWDDGEATTGRLLVESDLGFEVTFASDGASLAPIAGGCASCPDGPWSLDVERLIGEDGFEYRLTVLVDDLGPGFDSLIMVPSDGFKPEFAPQPDVDVYTGDFFAFAPSAAEPVLQSTCELSIVQATQLIQTFSCQQFSSGSMWSDELPDSWSSDDAGATFATAGAEFDGVFEGDEDYRTLDGQITVDGEVVGAFEMVKLTP